MPRLELPLRYMEENMSKGIGRHELAKLVSLSDTRFHYVFKNATGLAPLAYLKHVRLKKAQALLFQTDMQVSEIGAHVGYPDIFHFSKIFKGMFHISPLEYRRESRMWLMEGKGRDMVGKD